MYPQFDGKTTTRIRIREERAAYAAIDRPKNYRAKLANASIRTARSCLAVSEKIILATLRYFFLPGLAQKGNPRGRRPIKSGKHIPMGLFIHKIKDYETTDYQKDWQTCNSDIPDYRNMSADKQRDCPHRDDYAAVACRRILRFPVQDTGHYFQDSYSSVHCRIICRITQNINIHIWKQLL